MLLKTCVTFITVEKKAIHAFNSKIFPIKTKATGYLESKPSSFKILTPNQMLKRLPIVLAIIQKVY